MKKTIIIFGILFLSIFGFSQSFDPSKSMRPILNDINAVVEQIETQAGYEIVRIECDIIGTESKESYRILSPSWTYRVGVMGDAERVADMDLEVYKREDDGNYTLVIKDTKIEPSAIVDFTPTSNGWYKFVIKCYKFKPGYNVAHYGLIVLHQ